MTFTKTVTAMALALAAASAQAFVALPTDGTRISGTSNLGTDPLFIGDGGLSGTTFSDPVSGATIFNINLPSNLQLITSIGTNIALPDEDDPSEIETVGTFYDAVFTDTNDGFLVFGSRIVTDFEEDDDDPGEFEWAEAEINDIFRSGFEGTSVSVGWTRTTTADLRMFTAAHSETSGVDVAEGDPEVLNLDVVTMQSDINGEEGNPFSGWYLIKTNATEFERVADAVGLYQAGEEDQEPFLFEIDGFVPVAPEPVPVPAALPLFLSAIGFLAVRKRQA